ncbi:MAG: putative lipid II flippase FtsW [Elusimicrobia bacterium]|nr:putative lipid II flippase FtsW [Elusimicrobiota bacterium]
MSARRREIDYTLLSIILALVCWGLVMVYSSSAIWAKENLGSSLYFLKRQLFWSALGLGAMWILSRTDYRKIREAVMPIFVLTALALAVALLGHPVAGVRRWIRLGPFGVEPSEFAKLTTVIYLAHYFDRNHRKVKSLAEGLLVPLGMVGILLLLIGAGRDLGTPVLIFGVSVIMIYAGGGRVSYVFGAVAAGVPVVAYELIKYPYRRARVLNFLDPFKNARGAGYQLAQSLIAVGSGGWFGKGLGASQLKLMYLPAPYTDFIFPVLCEETGLFGGLALIALFAWFLVRGMRAAKRAPDLFGALLAGGITLTISLQAFFNMAMSIGLLPTKGIPLPFMSFGGSSLLSTLMGAGILLNISRQGAYDAEPA